MARTTRSGKSAAAAAAPAPAPGAAAASPPPPATAATATAAPDAARTGLHVKSYNRPLLIIAGLKPGMINTKERSESPLSSPVSFGDPALDPLQRHLSDRACPICWLSFDDLHVMAFRDHVETCVDGATGAEDTGPAPPREETVGVDTDAAMTDEELAKLDDLAPYTAATTTPEGDLETSEGARPITEPQRFLEVLARPQKQSNKALYANTKAACEALAAWQDEWMALDQRLIQAGVHTAPDPSSKKKSRNPRPVLERARWEDLKESILYGYKLDNDIMKVGMQDPKSQGAGKGRGTGRMANGRSSRFRQPTGATGTAASGAVVKVSTRQRKPTQKFEGSSQPQSRASTAAAAPPPPPPALSAVARGKKRARDDDSPPAEESEAPPRKKLGRPRKVPSKKVVTEAPPTTDDDEHATAAVAAPTTTTKQEVTPAPAAAPSPPARRPRGRPPKNAPKVAAPAKATKTAAKQQPPPVALPMPAAAPTTASSAVDASGPTRAVKGKVKSEKRSEAMTAWWALRRAAGTHRKAKNTDPAVAVAAAAEEEDDEDDDDEEEVEKEEEVVVPKKSAPGRKRKAVVEEEPSRAVGGVKRLKLTTPRPPSTEGGEASQQVMAGEGKGKRKRGGDGDGDEGGKVAKRPKRAAKGRKE